MRMTWIAAALLAGTGLGTAQAADPVTLQFWDNQQSESGLSQYQRAAVQRFEAENPGIKVDVTTIPYPEYQQRLLTAVQSGNPPDVSTVDQVWVAAFARAGAILPLGDKAAAGGIKADAFFPGAWSSAVYDQTLWGIPFNVDVWSFSFVNNAMFKAAGVDPASLATWAGMKQAGEKLTSASAGKYGLGLFAHKGEDTVVVLDSFIFSNEGRILDESGKCALTSPEAVGALTYLASLAPYAPKGIANAAAGDMRELFLNGSLAVEFWPALEQPTLAKSKLDWDFVAGTAPEGRKPVGTYGGWNLVVYKNSPRQEAAWKFIQFLTRPDINGAVVDLVPANIDAAKTFLQANRKNPESIMQLLQNSMPRPLSPKYLQVSDIQVNLAQDVFAGMAPKDAAAKACSAIDQLD